MTVWVYRDGKMVDKATCPVSRKGQRSDLPSPRVSRFETIESPVTGESISSWRARDRDMTAADAVDPRDLPRKPFERRSAELAARRTLDPTQSGLGALDTVARTLPERTRGDPEPS